MKVTAYNPRKSRLFVTASRVPLAVKYSDLPLNTSLQGGTVTEAPFVELHSAAFKSPELKLSE